MERINSKSNERLKFARKIRKGKIQSHIFIEGLRLCEEILRSKIDISGAFISDEFLGSNPDVIERLPQEKVSIASDKLFSSIADTKNSQGIVLICEKPDEGKARIERSLTPDPHSKIVLLLSEIDNPGNLGTIARTAEATGVAGIAITKGSANAFLPKTIRASMGAVIRIPIWQDVSFSEALDWAKSNGLITTAAIASANTSYLYTDWSKSRMIIFGNEAHGLSRDQVSQVEHSISIPMASDIESLNIAISCGIILFEARRQIFGQ